MRELRWKRGRAWFASDPAELFSAIHLRDPAALASVHAFTFPAAAAADAVAVAVELRHQQSGSSYLACLAGRLAPGSGGELAVTLRLPPDSAGLAEVVAAIAAGVESLPERPSGRLEIWCPFVHPVDLVLKAWARCAATLCRLMLPDVPGMSYETIERAARESANLYPGNAPIVDHPETFISLDAADAVASAASSVRAVAKTAIAWRRRFRVALAGGSTPRALYPHLLSGVDWRHADIFLGDERVVPPDHPRSNYRMVRETLLAPGGIPDANVFRWHTEWPDLDAAAAAYEQALRASDAPLLDLALLGLGPDGHTASLFPGTAALAVEDRLATVVDVPAVGARRLTLTYPALLGAADVFFLVTGRDKRDALADVLRPESTLPAARIIHRGRPVRIFCDREAWRNQV